MSTSDPVIHIEVEGVRLLAPLSSQVPHFLQSYERYALNVAALAQLVSESDQAPTMIDVGANVGDTVALARSTAPRLPILCIEGDPDFAELLKRNVGEWSDVEIHAPCLLAEVSGEIAGRLEPGWGTARVKLEPGAGASVSSLDDVLNGYPRFSSPALIKSDTDGFEARVLAGATKTLERARPILLLEYDPQLLAACGSDGLELLARLREHEYRFVVVYDNFGEVLCKADLQNAPLLKDLHRYASRRSSFYFDLAVFPESRASDAQEFYERETEPRGQRTRMAELFS